MRNERGGAEIEEAGLEQGFICVSERICGRVAVPAQTLINFEATPQHSPGVRVVGRVAQGRHRRIRAAQTTD